MLSSHSGFSDTACRILDSLKAKYGTVNVLNNDHIRSGIKEFSSWPTIPQLYVRGEFVGGSDIMVELNQDGRLASLLSVQQQD